MLTLLLAEERNFSLVRKLHKRKTTDHVGKKITLAKQSQNFVECKRAFSSTFFTTASKTYLVWRQFHQIATALGQLGHGD